MGFVVVYSLKKVVSVNVYFVRFRVLCFGCAKIVFSNSVLLDCDMNYITLTDLSLDYSSIFFTKLLYHCFTLHPARTFAFVYEVAFIVLFANILVQI